MLFAVSLVPLMATVTGVVEFTNIVRTKSALQDSLDAALVGIALNACVTSSESELEAKGIKFFKGNGNEVIRSGATLDYLGVTIMPDSSLRYTANVTKQYKGEMSATLNGPIKVISAVQRQSGPNACLLALSETASSAVDFNGSTDVDLANCIIAANSSSPTSVTRSGAANVTADCVQTVGKTSGIASNSRVSLSCPQVRERSFKTPDPLALVVAPSGTGCSSLNIPNGSGWKTINPGTYCDSSLTVNGGKKIRFNSGTYIFKGTAISFLGNSEIEGTGVTIFLYDGAKIKTSANSIVNLLAPTSGTYPGILIYTAPDNPVSLDFSGGTTQKLQGFIYNPKGHIDFKGDAGTTSDKCVRIVTNTIKLTGSSKLKMDCKSELGNRDITTTQGIRFVK